MELFDTLKQKLLTNVELTKDVICKTFDKQVPGVLLEHFGLANHCVTITNDSLVKSVHTLWSTYNQDGAIQAEFDGIAYVRCENEEFLFVNHEIKTGSVSRLTYKDGQVTSHTKWADGLTKPCSIFKTPYNTLLTNEESYDDTNVNTGYVYELNPTKQSAPIKIEGLGRLNHEKTIFVPNKCKYEYYTTDDDRKGGCLYKYVPKHECDLTSGALYVFTSKSTGDVMQGEWKLVKQPTHTKNNNDGVKFFKMEGLTYNVSDKHVYICTRTDATNGFGSIFRLNTKSCIMTKWLDCNDCNGKLINPDNMESDDKGNLYVCEHKDTENKKCNNRLVRINIADKSIQTLVEGTDVYGEMTGIAFHPSFTKLWCNWKNGKRNGETYSELFELEVGNLRPLPRN